MKKILITGGHVTPALAVIDELIKNNWQIFYVGRKYALEGDKAISQEYRLIHEKNLAFLTLTSGRLQRRITPHTFFSLLKIPFGFFQSLLYILSVRPRVILSFGGYIALPIVMAGWLMGVPVVTHEQTLVPGLANKIISRFARKICVSWETTKKLFPTNKTILTGNPMRKELKQSNTTLQIPHDRPLLFITGGNLGAHSISVVIESALSELIKKYTVIHQCGNAQEFGDFERLSQIRKSLSPLEQKRYYVFTYIDTEDLGWILQHADLLISRSGANILTEIIEWNLPAILIPLPWSGGSEQEKNAQFLVSQNAAVFLDQDDLNQERLLQVVAETFKKSSLLKNQLKKIQTTLPKNPAQTMVRVIESVA